MTDTLGQTLRAAREARGETLEDVARVTHIHARQLSVGSARSLLRGLKGRR